MAAALLAGMTACNTLDNPATTDTPKTYTMTVTATKSPDEALTRALSLDGKTLNAAWKAGDKVEVYTVTEGANYVSVYTQVGTLTASADGATTTFTGTVTFSGKPRLELYYGSPSWTYEGQKGTLEDISDNFDYAMVGLSASKYTINGGVIVPTTSPLKFTNQQAIVKFILRDADGTPLETNSLTLKKTGMRYFNLNHDVETSSTTNDDSFTVTCDGASSIFFVAIHPVYDFGIRLETSKNGFNYYCERSSVEFNRGKYYEVTVNMSHEAGTIDLSNLTGDLTLVDGDILTGILDGSTQKVKISIEDGATVTLSDAAIEGVSSETDCFWAGLTCLGDATIVLADGTTNTVTNFYRCYPCIQSAVGKTLVIKGGPLGTGKLIANNSEYGAGIGAGCDFDCGNIEIQGGIITATGGNCSAGIGGGQHRNCGDISITGGTVTATGYRGGAGIGSGDSSLCGNITITGGTVIATGGNGSAGLGCGNGGSCGNIRIIGCNVKAQGYEYGTGIGCGNGDSTSPSVCGDISISSEKGDFRVVAIRGDEAFRPIGISFSSNIFNRCGKIYLDGWPINELNQYNYDPNNGKYGDSFFEKSTQRLGDRDKEPGNEHIYDNNTWTLWHTLSM